MEPGSAYDSPGIADESSSHDERARRRAARRRALGALILLLLLLLCTVVTVTRVWFDQAPEVRRFIVRNVECLSCHTDMLAHMTKSSVHQPFAMKECTVCHTPHGREIERMDGAGSTRAFSRATSFLQWLPLRLMLSVLGASETTSSEVVEGQTDETGAVVQGSMNRSNLTMPLEELCWVCHGTLGVELSMAFQHAPFEMSQCTGCHDPHASDWGPLLMASRQDLCVMCHRVNEDMGKEQVHLPFENRHCTNCHKPHASEYRGILTMAQRDLCFSCHPTVAGLSRRAVLHQPFANDNCTGCHEPHAARFLPLLVDEEPRLCYECHPGIEDDFGLPSAHPVGGVALNCSGCHQPHAADVEVLLVAKDNLLCYECHATAIRTTYEASNHRRTLCIGCHTPHGSIWAPILRDRNPDLCLRCHPGYEGYNKHPVRPVAAPRRAGGVLIATAASNRALTCTSGCHRPHGTMYPRMLTYAYRVDGLCLSCHPPVGKSF